MGWRQGHRQGLRVVWDYHYVIGFVLLMWFRDNSKHTEYHLTFKKQPSEEVRASLYRPVLTMRWRIIIGPHQDGSKQAHTHSDNHTFVPSRLTKLVHSFPTATYITNIEHMLSYHVERTHKYTQHTAHTYTDTHLICVCLCLPFN